MTFVPIAALELNGMTSSVHYGAYVALDREGDVAAWAGDPDVRVFARSAWKPAQAAAMASCGLDLPDELLAIVCASHSGGPTHVRLVRALLRRVGASESLLANTPDLPLDEAEARTVIAAGGAPTPMTANCSGKHAGMIATCLLNQWPVNEGAYLQPEHPLQRNIWTAVQRLAGPTVRRAGPDGCGAPTFTCSLRAVADAFRRLAAAPSGTSEHRVYRAMTRFPVHCGGVGRIATDVMLAVPGLVAKDGAEGVFAAAHPDGRAIALKIADGSSRARRPVLAGALTQLGFDMAGFEHAGAIGPRTDGRPLFRVRAL